MNAPIITPPLRSASARTPSTRGTVLESRVAGGPLTAPAELEGRLPDWLRGRLVRTAPALLERGRWRAEHWFDGLGMLYRFDLEAADRVRFAARLLDSEYAAQAATGTVKLAAFGTASHRSVLERLVAPAPKATDNANVSLLPLPHGWLAMTETHRQLAIEPTTLQTLGEVRYADELPAGMSMTAHPLVDHAAGEVVNVGTILGPRPELVVYAHALGSTRRRVIGRWRTPRVPYVHSFGLSSSRAVLIAHPFDVAPASLLFSNRFIEHYRWRPEQGTRLVVIDRSTGASRIAETEPMFVFHTINTFDDGDEVVMDALVYDDASTLLHDMRPPQLLERLPFLRPIPTRLRIGAHGVRRERLGDVGFEFPTINAPLHAGLPYRRVWGAALDGTPAQPRSAIVALDVAQGITRRFEEGDFAYGEPLFVAAPHGTAEDDGVLLTVGASPSRRATRLRVLRAADLEPLAAATVDTVVPLGFHGAFEPSAAG